MKLTILICFTLLLIGVSITSCKLPCSSRSLSEVVINNFSRADDSILVIKTYRANSNFTNAMDSVTLNAVNGFGFNFVSNSEYQIVVYPSGKIHTLQNIHFGNEKDNRVGDGLESDQCYVSVSYKIDDSLVNLPEGIDLNNAAVYITN